MKNIILKLGLISSILSVSLLGAEMNLPKEDKNNNNNNQPIQNMNISSNPNDYQKVVSGSVLEEKNNNTENMNVKQSYAYNLGLQEGYELGKKIAEEEMIAKLHSMEKYLDQIFNFQRLYIENKIEPPKVVIRKSPVETFENGKMLIIEQEQIEIVEPARLVSDPKTWKNFLIVK